MIVMIIFLVCLKQSANGASSSAMGRDSIFKAAVFLAAAAAAFFPLCHQSRALRFPERSFMIFSVLSRSASAFFVTASLSDFPSPCRLQRTKHSFVLVFPLPARLLGIYGVIGISHKLNSGAVFVHSLRENVPAQPCSDFKFLFYRRNGFGARHQWNRWIIEKGHASVNTFKFWSGFHV